MPSNEKLSPYNPFIMVNKEINPVTKTIQDKDYSYFFDKERSALSKGGKLYSDCWKQGFFTFIGEFTGDKNLAVSQCEKSEWLIALSMLGLGVVYNLANPGINKSENKSGLHSGMFSYVNPAAWLAVYPTMLTVICLNVTHNLDNGMFKFLGALASSLLVAISLPLLLTSALINLVVLALAAVIQTVITPFWMLGKAIELKYEGPTQESSMESSSVDCSL